MTAYIRDVRSFCIRGTILIPMKSDVRDVHVVQYEMHMSYSTRCACQAVRDVHVVHRLITTSWEFDYNLPTKVLGEQLSYLLRTYYNPST